jgi:ABC-type branched-subunit amino acid transport system ATPase component
VLVGCHRRGQAGWAACAFRTRAMREEERQLRTRARRTLELVGLEARADVPANLLTYGEQRLVEVARALGMGPRLLLLAEPGAGLSPAEHLRLAALIKRIRDGGTTVLLVDHHMDFVMDISDEVLVLSYGEKLAEGAPQAVRRNPAVIEAYLGEEPD